MNTPLNELNRYLNDQLLGAKEPPTVQSWWHIKRRVALLIGRQQTEAAANALAARILQILKSRRVTRRAA